MVELCCKLSREWLRQGAGEESMRNSQQALQGARVSACLWSLNNKDTIFSERY